MSVTIRNNLASTGEKQAHCLAYLVCSSHTSCSPPFSLTSSLPPPSSHPPHTPPPTGPHSLLSVSSLSDKSSCQLHAAIFLTHIYINWTLVHSTELDEDDPAESVGVLAQGDEAPRKFDVSSALLTCLSDQDKSKAINIQMVR